MVLPSCNGAGSVLEARLRLSLSARCFCLGIVGSSFLRLHLLPGEGLNQIKLAEGILPEGLVGDGFRVLLCGPRMGLGGVRVLRLGRFATLTDDLRFLERGDLLLGLALRGLPKQLGLQLGNLTFL